MQKLIYSVTEFESVSQDLYIMIKKFVLLIFLLLKLTGILKTTLNQPFCEMKLLLLVLFSLVVLLFHKFEPQKLFK
jgi:hypothetical protein